MANNRQDENIDNQYRDQDTDTDTTGIKGGTSQQSYNDRSTERNQNESGFDTDEEMNETTSGW